MTHVSLGYNHKDERFLSLSSLFLSTIIIITMVVDKSLFNRNTQATLTQFYDTLTLSQWREHNEEQRKKRKELAVKMPTEDDKDPSPASKISDAVAARQVSPSSSNEDSSKKRKSGPPTDS